MSTSKNIDKICISAIAITLILSILIAYVPSFRLESTDALKGYESRLFSTDRVHTIDIVMDNWDEFIENCENEEYSPCTLVIDDEKFSNIAIRAKGNTSLSNVSSLNSQRYSFKLEFDQYDDGKSYYGLDKLCLNNIIQDNTMMKDYLVYQMMGEFGVDAPLCSYSYITVNDEDWGLYLAVESIEDSFIDRNYGSNSGDLYKPDSMSFGGGRGNGKGFDMKNFDFGDNDSTLSEAGIPDFDNNPFRNNVSENVAGDNKDFTRNMPGDFPGGEFKGGPPQGGEPGTDFGGGFKNGSDDVKLKYIDDNPDSYSNIFDNAKTIVTDADKTRLISSLKNLSEYSNIDETVNVDEVLRYFVVHNFVCNGDSYTGSMIHNYYLYEKDGVLSMIPWDYNLAFGSFQAGDSTEQVNTSIDEPVSGDVNDRPMVGWIFSSEEYTNMYHDLFGQFIDEWLVSGKLNQLINDTAAMIEPYVEKDPTKFCTTEEFKKGVKAIEKFVNYRTEAVSNQLNGDDTTVDASDLNLSDMGTMNVGGNGGEMGPGGPGSQGSGFPTPPDISNDR